jgi:hypothetical protein
MSNPLTSLFARSPLGPIQNHMRVVYTGVEKLLDFFAAAQANDWDRAEAVYKEISELETEADKIKRDIRLHLPSGLFLAVPRGDLLNVLSKQDMVVNKAQDIAGLVLGRKMTIPETLWPDFQTFVKRGIDATRQARDAIDELDELLTVGFRGREVELVEKMIRELERIESDTDVIQIRLRRSLHALESELPPVDVIFLYKIVDWVGELADRAQRVGTRLELMVAS